MNLPQSPTNHQSPGQTRYGGPVDPTRSAPGLVDLADILRVVWRGKYVIALAILVASVLGYLIKSQIPHVYGANAQIMLDTREGRVLTVEQVVANITVNDATVASEISMLQSTGLLQQVIDELELISVDEFSTDLMEEPFYVRVVRWGLALGKTSDDKPEAARVPNPVQLLSAFRQHLSVRQEGISYVIDIGFRSQDPALAAATVNKLVHTYIGRQHAERLEATQRATFWLETRIAALRMEVERAEAAVLLQRADNLLLGQGGLDVATQQIAELSRDVSDAQAERIRIEAERRRLEEVLEIDGLAAAADVISTPLTINLRAERAQLSQEARETETRYGVNHPRMLSIQAQIAAVEDGLSEEVSARLATLSSELDVAEVREDLLRKGLRSFEERIVALSNASIETNQLIREADAVRAVYESMLLRLYETRAQEALIRADVRIVSLAEVPESAISPRTKLILAMSAFIGGALGLGFVFLRELALGVFRNPAEIEAALGLPVLVNLPKESGLRSAQTVSWLISSPNSELTERCRQMRTSLLFGNEGVPPRSIMVTSSVRYEGKTTTVLGLALVSQWAGLSTIVVDADLRNPSLSEHFDWSIEHDIMSVMRGDSYLEEAIRTDPKTGIDVLPCAPSQQAALGSDRLSSSRFGHLMQDLHDRYDIVILDSPSTLFVADARVIGQSVDTSVYLVKVNGTDRTDVATGVAALREVGVNIAGVVLTMATKTKT